MNTVVQHLDITLSEVLDAVLFIHIRDAQTKQVCRINIKVIEEQILNHTQENLSRNMKAEHWHNCLQKWKWSKVSDSHKKQLS